MRTDVKVCFSGLLLMLSLSAFATDHMVTVGGGPLAFDPATLTVDVGDTVTFTNAGGFHNATSDPDAVTAFRCANGCDGDGNGGDGAPSGSAWTFTITLDTAGTVGYHCEIHGAPGGGMFGTITVNPATTPDPIAEVTPPSLAFTLEPDQAASDEIQIANTGDASSELDYTIAEAPDDCASPADVPWLSASPQSGMVTGGFSAGADVAVQSDGLAAGDYSGLLCISTNDPLNALISVPVSLTVAVPDLIFAGDFEL
ncbi:MAG: plastocyanin/azurin family copper-binding protein [Rhodanobacteraceae bacterium]